MRDVLNYIETIMQDFPEMSESERKKEICHIREMFDNAMQKYDEATMRRVNKLEQENYRLRVLLDTAAEAIADLREQRY